MTPQPGILAPVPPRARFTVWGLAPEADVRDLVARLSAHDAGPDEVWGLGPPLLRALGAEVGVHTFTARSGPGVTIPSTQGALLCRFSGTDAGDLIHAERRAEDAMGAHLRRAWSADAFVHDGGRDLTGYVDGTENPTGDDAARVALRADGSSTVVVQPWVHDLSAFERFGPAERDRMIGRTRAGDVELDDAPPSAHVKRTAQEDFTPEAFVVRRSMPFSSGPEHGLVFVAFGHTTAAFDAQLDRMLGRDDGVVDALFRFTRPVGGGAYWCPPAAGSKLDLSGLATEPWARTNGRAIP